LAQLFEDMQMMVEQQGETLDQVEEHAQNAQGDLEQGVKQVSRAIVLARSTRAVSFLYLFV
jgi:syntaxin 1B/2/3